MADYTKELSKNSKKAYKWLCDFIGEKLKISDHAWYGPTIWLDIDKLGITDDMLETINDEFYKHMNDWGVNQISAESGIWGRGNTYLITFESQKEERVDDSTKMGLIKEVKCSISILTGLVNKNPNRKEVTTLIKPRIKLSET